MQYLVQDLILLALNPQTGEIRYAASSVLRYSLMGAVLLDLVLQEKLTIENNHLIAADTTTAGDKFLDQCFNEVLAASRTRTVKFWVSRWSQKYSKFQTVVLQNLVNLGVLVQQEQLVLWLFPVQRYFLADESIQRALVSQVRAAILEDTGLDSPMAALISLIKASHLTKAVFTPEERREARLRIQAIAQGEQVGKAVSETIASTLKYIAQQPLNNTKTHEETSNEQDSLYLPTLSANHLSNSSVQPIFLFSFPSFAQVNPQVIPRIEVIRSAEYS
jgi:golgi phosphoprotein 3